MGFDNDALPRQFGQYLLKKCIARGGMAELYLGETRGPGGFSKPVVVKMIHDRFSEDQRFLSMFTDEAKILADLAHGNIVPIFDFGTVEGRLYLVMEFIDGVDVATIIDTCRLQGFVLSLDVALWIGIGCSAGLSHAHQATDTQQRPLGIVHRDMSPQNILASRSGEVKLCDFGIAMSAAKEAETDAGIIKGKLRYLSPEQARGETIDVRSDIFSLGVVLYELVTGHHPVVSGADVIVMQTLSGDKGYPLLGQAAPWVPQTVAKAVDRAMSFDPNQRCQSAEAFGQELSRILYGQFPDFTPKRLADLVCQVQAANEKSKSPDIDAVIRANLASFASSVRKATEGGTKPVAPAAKRRWIAPAALGAGLVLVLAVLWIGLLDKSADGPVEPPELTDQPPGSANDPGMSSAVASVVPDVASPSTADSDRSGESDTDSAGPDAGRTATASAADAGIRAGETDDKARQPAVKPRRRAFGLLNVQADPWAEVKIAGVSKGETPIMGLKMPVGKHKATLVNPELGVTQTHSFVIRADETTQLIVKMK